MNAAPQFHDWASRFSAEISAAGLVPPEVIETEGELHRFASNGKRGDQASWYVLHCDGIPAGAFDSWCACLTETWHADIGRSLTDAERDGQRQRIEAAKKKVAPLTPEAMAERLGISGKTRDNRRSARNGPKFVKVGYTVRPTRPHNVLLEHCIQWNGTDLGPSCSCHTYRGGSDLAGSCVVEARAACAR